MAALLAGLVGPALAGPPAAPDAFAIVGDSVITVQEYAMALRSEARRRFYHFQPPEQEMAAFQREVAEQLIEHALAAQEARRRGLRPDQKAIDRHIEQTRSRLAKANAQQHADEKFWTALRRELEQQQLVKKLRDQERLRIKPTDEQLHAYYLNNPDKFTEPARLRVSVILLRVNPSSPQAAWDAAEREAQKLVERTGNGADFAELARLHSADGTAANGGAMGYLHRGMLSPTVDEALAALQPGEISAPVIVLEGIALFKLHERQAARLAEYATVRARVEELWMRAEEERAWKALVEALRSTTTVNIEEKFFAPG